MDRHFIYLKGKCKNSANKTLAPYLQYWQLRRVLQLISQSLLRLQRYLAEVLFCKLRLNKECYYHYHYTKADFDNYTWRMPCSWSKWLPHSERVELLSRRKSEHFIINSDRFLILPKSLKLIEKNVFVVFYWKNKPTVLKLAYVFLIMKHGPSSKE